MRTALLQVFGSVLVGLPLGGCAYVTAVPTAGNPSINGIRVYSPKALVVVNGTGVSTVIVPDCSKEYALKFGTVFAKQKVTVDLSNGMVTKVDVDQDTTAIPLKLLDLANKVIPSLKGSGTSDKATGGVADRFGIFEASCSDGRLQLAPLNALETGLIKAATAAPQPQPIPLATPHPDPNGDKPIER